MNVYDSSRMADVLAPLGYSVTDDATTADLVLLNTCHIREKAAEKVFSELGRLRRLKTVRRAEGREMLIGVAGCVAQAEGEEIRVRAPFVDLVFGPQTYHRLPEMLAAVHRAADAGVRPAGPGRGVLETDFPVEPKFDHLPPPRTDGPGAFLSIQEGCDKFCSFCVVPYTRGAEYSRPAEDVLAEARHLVAGGVVELTLLGQNVNAYRAPGPNGRDWTLARLLRALAEQAGQIRLRYTTSHPRDMDDDLIRAHAEIDAVMPHLHLPVQSGSDRVLREMNRRHTADDYRRVVDRLREARPDIALSSDFIVGFPGERDADFAETLRLVTEVGYAQAYSFKYSARPGTPASSSSDQVPEAVRTDRLASLQQLLGAQQLAFNRHTVGTVQSVLLDRPGRREGQLGGRTPYMQAVHVDAPAWLAGRVVPVRILAAHGNSLAGQIDAVAARSIAATADGEPLGA